CIAILGFIGVFFTICSNLGYLSISVILSTKVFTLCKYVFDFSDFLFLGTIFIIISIILSLDLYKIGIDLPYIDKDKIRNVKSSKNELITISEVYAKGIKMLDRLTKMRHKFLTISCRCLLIGITFLLLPFILLFLNSMGLSNIIYLFIFTVFLLLINIIDILYRKEIFI
ncbi:MAG: hypothetical protein KKI14_03490, partial [Nanoarchaeota archaeon]|nr:hypothetical protein [Nanoarchaeota archaeon]